MVYFLAQNAYKIGNLSDLRLWLIMLRLLQILNQIKFIAQVQSLLSEAHMEVCFQLGLDKNIQT